MRGRAYRLAVPDHPATKRPSISAGAHTVFDASAKAFAYTAGMRIWLAIVGFVIACGKGGKSDNVPPAPPPASAQSAAADAPALPHAVLDDSVAVIDPDPCTTDCKAKCAAKLLSACINAVDQTTGDTDFEPRCNAGEPNACRNLKMQMPAESATWGAKEKAAQAAVEGACYSGDAWSCLYALPTNVERKPLWEKACALGLPTYCVFAAEDAVGADGAGKVRHFAQMFGRACKERKDAKLCRDGADAAAAKGDTSAATALRKRGMEIASTGCAADNADAIVPCLLQAGLADTLGDRAAADAAFAHAVKLADAGCKALSIPSCRTAAALYAGRFAVPRTAIDDVLPPARLTNADLAKPFLAEACRLAWKANPKTEPIECVQAGSQQVDITPLMPPGATKRGSEL